MMTKHMLRWITIVVVISFVVPTWAQTAADNSAATTESTMVDGRASLIAFEKESSIREGLRILAAMYEKNIVPSAQVDGVLGFTKLRDVTFEEAMNAVLGSNFVYEDDGHIINVYGKEEYKKIKSDPDRLTHKIYTLYYMSAAEASKLLQPILSPNGSIQASSPPETVVPTGESISGGANGGDSMALNDHIVVMDYPEYIAQVDTMLAQLDVRPKQVLVEATIMSATLTEETQFGINWSDIAGTTVTQTAAGIDTTGFTNGINSGLSIGVTSNTTGAIIKALEEITDLTVLANPKVMAVNKQLGQVYIGKKLGYRDNSNTLNSGVISEGEVKFLDTGTKLSFRPYIGNDGYIRMDIHPKDSTGDLVDQIPEEQSTEVATNIMVRDGETIVIGGLFRTAQSKSRNQVPVLGSLPLVGSLFRGVDDSNKREEVIIMLTPHIVKDDDDCGAKMAKTDIDRREAGVRDDYGMFTHTKIVEKAYLKAAKAYMEGDIETALREVNVALSLRPTYIEAIRLKERIISETDPDAYEKLDRIITNEMDWQEAASWK